MTKPPVTAVRSRSQWRSGLRIAALAWWSLTGGSAVADPARALGAGPEPFRRLRETTLGYHGPAEDLTNRTELRLGWFGPTNLDASPDADVWWSVDRALREADEPPVASVIPASGHAEAAPSVLPMRWLACWAADPWGSGAARLTRMVYDGQPLALLGSVDSASTHLAEQVAAKANLALVSPLTTDKTVTLAGVSWMFTCAPSDAVIARVLVEDVLATLDDAPARGPIGGGLPDPNLVQPGPRAPDASSTATAPLPAPCALLAATDHASRMTAREVVREFSRRGRLPAFRFDLPPGVSDLSRQRAAMKDSPVAAVVLVAGPEDSARWARAVRSWDQEPDGARPSGHPARSPAGVGEPPSPRVFGSHTLGRTRFVQEAGSAAEGVRFPLLCVPDPADPATARFAEAFTRARGHPPDYAAVLAYDAARLLVAAARRAGPSRVRFREALIQLSPWRGLGGTIAFDGTGQNRRSNVVMGTVRDGAVVPLAASDSSVISTVHR